MGRGSRSGRWGRSSRRRRGFSSPTRRRWRRRSWRRRCPRRSRSGSGLLQRFGPLVGVEAASPAERQELFTAWRRYLAGLAAARPSVLVFEDLHWADEALLAFLEHLAEWAEGVPLLLLCTARPELYERRAGWASGQRNSDDDQPAAALGCGDGRARFPSDYDQRAQRGAGAARAGAGGRQPLVCGGVRAPARRPRPGCRRGGVAGEFAGVDRRPTGHAFAGAEESASGRGCSREGVLGGCAGRDRRPRPGRARAGSARAGPEGACPPGAGELDGGRERVLVLASARPRCRLRPDPQGGAGAPAPRRGRLDRAQGRRAGRGPGGGTRLPLPAGARARRGGR